MTLQVRSHVARDFLQSSAYFNTVPKIAWEYVSNALDNPRGNQPVHCRVQIGNGRLIVEDDARGMSRSDLERFFTMHGENKERAAGRTVRGRFGTGKSAAFGLANALRVTSVKDGRRNIVELRREDIEAAKDGEPFAVRDLVTDEPTADASGTKIEIEGLTTKASDVAQTQAYIERRLGRFRAVHNIVINNHPLQHEEPPFTEEYSFVATSPLLAPAEAQAPVLKIRTAPAPLDENTNGVDILSRGVWHETTLLGVSGRERAEYLYGFVDLPVLEDDKGPVPAFDNTRSGHLNAANPLVASAYAWIEECLESVRLKLVEKDRERKRTAEAKRLKEEADRIAQVLNADFDAWRAEFRRAAGRLGQDLGHMTGTGEGGEDVLPGPGSDPSPFVMTGPPAGDGSRGEGAGRDGTEERPGSGLAPGEGTGSPTSPDGATKRRRAGGFSLEYESATESEPRSRYDEDSRTIFINLDHPQIAAARGSGIESRSFRQLSYEVAFSEYALALPMDMARAQGAIFDAQDAIVEARLTLNRIARLGAALYEE